jgi:hypothetical protein
LTSVKGRGPENAIMVPGDARVADEEQPQGSSMAFTHAVVWLDHDQARIIHFGLEESEEQRVHAASRDGNLHHRKGAAGSGRAPEDRVYYHEVALGLRGAKEILVTGPSGAKIELIKHLEEHDKDISRCVVGFETLDHPSDGQLLAFARKYFRAADRLLPQR